MATNQVLLRVLFPCVSSTDDRPKSVRLSLCRNWPRHPRTPPRTNGFCPGTLALALATHRVWVLGGRLGMRWSSLQVTLKSSSWWHSQGGDAHPLPHRLPGRASSSPSCSRYPGLIFQGTSWATPSLLRAVASFSVSSSWRWRRPGSGRDGREEEDSEGLWPHRWKAHWRGGRRGSQVLPLA